MPISEPQRSFFGGNTYREVTCSKCGYNTKTMGGGKAYASQVLENTIVKNTQGKQNNAS